MRGVYLKFTTGSSEERPCAGVAVLARTEEGICRELRLAVGAVSARPLRIGSGEARAQNRRLTKELIQTIADDAARAIEPVADVRGPADYKRHLVGVLVRRAIVAAANEAVETHS
jgi:carbon-monoxide dehydrogenase medium subunit